METKLHLCCKDINEKLNDLTQIVYEILRLTNVVRNKVAPTRFIPVPPSPSPITGPPFPVQPPKKSRFIPVTPSPSPATDHPFPVQPPTYNPFLQQTGGVNKDYRQKYLEYKQKYIELCEQFEKNFNV